jgi:uncharacterized protein (DUF433 family)
VKRTKKAKIKAPLVPTGMVSTAVALTPCSWCWPSKDGGLAEKQFKRMSLDEVFDLEARHTANAGSGLRRRVMQLISPGGTILQAYKDRLGGQLKRALSELEGLQELSPKVATAALKAFNSAQGAVNWLTSSEISLKGRTPLEVSKTKNGAKEVIILLKRTKKAKIEAASKDKPRLVRDPSSGLMITKGPALAKAWHWRIVSDPEILSGAPVFLGTRVPVRNLIDYLEAGDSIEEFRFDFPSVREDTA